MAAAVPEGVILRPERPPATIYNQDWEPLDISRVREYAPVEQSSALVKELQELLGPKVQKLANATVYSLSNGIYEVGWNRDSFLSVVSLIHRIGPHRLTTLIQLQRDKNNMPFMIDIDFRDASRYLQEFVVVRRRGGAGYELEEGSALGQIVASLRSVLQASGFGGREEQDQLLETVVLSAHGPTNKAPSRSVPLPEPQVKTSYRVIFPRLRVSIAEAGCLAVYLRSTSPLLRLTVDLNVYRPKTGIKMLGADKCYIFKCMTCLHTKPSEKNAFRICYSAPGCGRKIVYDHRPMRPCGYFHGDGAAIPVPETAAGYGEFVLKTYIGFLPGYHTFDDLPTFAPRKPPSKGNPPSKGKPPSKGDGKRRKQKKQPLVIPDVWFGEGEKSEKVFDFLQVMAAVEKNQVMRFAATTATTSGGAKEGDKSAAIPVGKRKQRSTGEAGAGECQRGGGGAQSSSKRSRTESLLLLWAPDFSWSAVSPSDFVRPREILPERASTTAAYWEKNLFVEGGSETPPPSQGFDLLKMLAAPYTGKDLELQTHSAVKINLERRWVVLYAKTTTAACPVQSYQRRHSGQGYVCHSSNRVQLFFKPALLTIRCLDKDCETDHGPFTGAKCLVVLGKSEQQVLAGFFSSYERN